MSVTNKRTNLNRFRNTIEKNIILSIRLKTIPDIKIAVIKLTDDIVSVAKIATPVAINGNYQLPYQLDIRKQVKKNDEIETNMESNG